MERRRLAVFDVEGVLIPKRRYLLFEVGRKLGFSQFARIVLRARADIKPVPLRRYIFVFDIFLEFLVEVDRPEHARRDLSVYVIVLYLTVKGQRFYLEGLAGQKLVPDMTLGIITVPGLYRRARSYKLGTSSVFRLNLLFSLARAFYVSDN